MKGKWWKEWNKEKNIDIQNKFEQPRRRRKIKMRLDKERVKQQKRKRKD